jgi:hypothetical protein
MHAGSEKIDVYWTAYWQPSRPQFELDTRGYSGQRMVYVVLEHVCLRDEPHNHAGPKSLLVVCERCSRGALHSLSACQSAIVVSSDSFSGVHLERRGQVAAKWGFRNHEHTTRARDGILQTYSTRSEITRP